MWERLIDDTYSQRSRKAVLPLFERLVHPPLELRLLARSVELAGRL